MFEIFAICPKSVLFLPPDVECNFSLFGQSDQKRKNQLSCLLKIVQIFVAFSEKLNFNTIFSQNQK